MKQGKRITREMKQLLSKRGYDWKEWMYSCEDEQAICFINKFSKEIAWVEKG